MEKEGFDVIIIGGSFAGLSAALSLGRALRRVLVIDSGNPCNRYTPHSHNFLTNDGETPADITANARAQVLQYPTVSCLNGVVTEASGTDGQFVVTTKEHETFKAKKLLFATGVTDTIPLINGFADCWGVSILHCPYCHGYEVKGAALGILGNGDMGYELAKTISHWTNKLTLYTNGTSTLSPEQVLLLNKHHILVVENDIEGISHRHGYITELHFKDAPSDTPEAIFTQLPFIQQCPVPQQMGCEMTDKGFIHVNKCMETSVPGVYAAGDCLTLFRSVANAVAVGNKTGAMINKQLIDEAFYA